MSYRQRSRDLSLIHICEIILKSLGAWVAIWGFSRLLNAPKKLECYTAGVGTVSYTHLFKN